MFLRFFCWGTNWWTSSAAANTATHCSPPKTPAFSELGKQTATRGEEWIFHHALNLAPKKLETVEPPLNLSKNLSLTSPSTNRLHDAVGASKNTKDNLSCEILQTNGYATNIHRRHRQKFLSWSSKVRDDAWKCGSFLRSFYGRFHLEKMRFFFSQSRNFLLPGFELNMQRRNGKTKTTQEVR